MPELKQALNLGGGQHDIGLDGYSVTNIDLFATSGNFIKHDLEELPYPFDDNEFDVIYASAILEHLRNLWGKDKCVLDELHRIIKPNGKMIVYVPHPSCAINWSEPTHRTMCGIGYFGSLEPEAETCYTKNHWRITKKELLYTRLGRIGKLINWLANRNKRTQYIWERFLCYYVGGFDLSYFELRPLEDLQ